MSPSSISVVIPIFNAEKTIERAIKSVLGQSLGPQEIILVNNNSTDASPELIKQYENHYPNLITSITEAKPGSNHARNAGLKIAIGTWIQLLDADDKLLPNKFEHQLKLIEQNPKTDLICSPVKTYSGFDGSYIKTIEAISDTYRGLVQSKLGITSSNLWRRSALTDIGLWDERRTSSQEYFTILELIKQGKKILIDPEINTIVYEYPESVSKSRSEEREFSIMWNKLNYFEELIDFLDESDKKQYIPEIFENIHKNIFTHLINYGPESRSELKAMKAKYDIKLKTRLLLTTYLHQTYSNKVMDKKNFTKYFFFAVEAVKDLGKLKKAISFLI